VPLQAEHITSSVMRRLLCSRLGDTLIRDLSSLGRPLNPGGLFR
jgi:hypothetical protein